MHPSIHFVVVRGLDRMATLPYLLWRLPPSTRLLDAIPGGITPPPIPLPYFESPVQRVRDWRHQDKAERSAGLKTPSVLVSSFICQVCGVHVGKGHVEIELYFWPVIGQRVCLVDRIRFLEFAGLLVCGGCARRRNLSESLLLVPGEIWQRHTILSRQYIEPRYQQLYHFYLTFAQKREQRGPVPHLPSPPPPPLPPLSPSQMSHVQSHQVGVREEQREEKPGEKSPALPVFKQPTLPYHLFTVLLPSRKTQMGA